MSKVQTPRASGGSVFAAAAMLMISAAVAQASGFATSGTVYTADETGNSVTKLDLVSGKTTTVPVAVSPHNVQVSPDGKTLLVVGTKTVSNVHGHGHDGAMGTLLVFDVSAFGKADPVEVEVGEHPAHVVVTPDGKRALVTNSEDNNVSLVDLASSSVVGTAPTGEGPHGLRVSPDGAEAYVANVGDGTVSVIDLKANTEAARIPVGKAPVQVGFTPDGSQVFVSLRDEDKVALIDTKTRKVLDRIAVGDGPIQVHSTADARYLLVANQGTEDKPGDTVSVIDIAGRKVIDTLKTAPGAHGVAVSSTGNLAFVTNIYDGTLSVVDLSNFSILANVKVGQGPNGVTYSQ